MVNKTGVFSCGYKVLKSLGTNVAKDIYGFILTEIKIIKRQCWYFP